MVRRCYLRVNLQLSHEAVPITRPWPHIRTNGHQLTRRQTGLTWDKTDRAKMLGAVSNTENPHQMLYLVWTLHRFTVLPHLPGARFLNQSFFNRRAECESPFPPMLIKVTHFKGLIYFVPCAPKTPPQRQEGREGWLDWWFPCPEVSDTFLIYIRQTKCLLCEIYTWKHLGTANRSEKTPLVTTTQ